MLPGRLHELRQVGASQVEKRCATPRSASREFQANGKGMVGFNKP